MRLGGHIFGANTVEELRRLTDKLDCYGLSAISAPGGLEAKTQDFCVEFGEVAAELDECEATKELIMEYGTGSKKKGVRI